MTPRMHTELAALCQLNSMPFELREKRIRCSISSVSVNGKRWNSCNHSNGRVSLYFRL